MQVFAQHLQTVPTPPSQRGPATVAPDLEQLVLSCLAKKPEDRPQSAAELNRRLGAVNVEPWTEVHAQEWWATTRASSSDLDGNVETPIPGRASGETATRLAIGPRETSDAPERADER